jgi:23S rRNA pseudouridine1911/1915/1917 synthase
VKITHRLDYDTSGLIVFSKDALTHSYLNYQLENNLFKKEYIAIVDGLLKNDYGVLDFPIGRNRHDSKKYLVSKTGKSAITRYQVIKRYANMSYVKVNIETGRTHQIRVHFSHVNHPIVGDELYGKGSDRMYLHASKLSFIHPNTRKEITVECKPTGGEKWIM